MPSCRTSRRAAEWFRACRLTLLGCCLLCAAAAPSRAQVPEQPLRWWGVFDLGAGNLHREIAGVSEATIRFYMDVAGGFVVHPQLLVGVEASGWLIEPGDLQDPRRGAAVSPIFLMARIYPSKMSSFHLRVGGGVVNDWRNRTGSSDWGSGFEIGAGYDVRLGRHVFLTPFATYVGGRIGDLPFHAFTAGAGVTMR